MHIQSTLSGLYFDKDQTQQAEKYAIKSLQLNTDKDNNQITPSILLLKSLIILIKIGTKKEATQEQKKNS